MGADVVVIGGGLIGLASTGALAARRVRVTLIAERRLGEASPAAAGMLAPGVERATGPAHDFAVAGRDFYPDYLAMLAAATGICVPLNRSGILELVPDDEAANARRGDVPPGAEWVSREALKTLEPALADVAGAVYHPDDGAVDNVVLLQALRRLVGASDYVTVLEERAEEVRLDSPPAAVRTAAGELITCESVVLAAGAWVSQLSGLPRALPVRPVRGQMISVSEAPLAHVTYGPNGYVVPRSNGTSVVGATMEEAGFQVATTQEGVAGLTAAAAEIAPALSAGRILARWSGLRPVTPDLLPIIGRDPDCPSLIYACGHSRNGILLGPITGDCVAELVTQDEPTHDLTPFSIERFVNLESSSARGSL